jgi:hypothetical protein
MLRYWWSVRVYRAMAVRYANGDGASFAALVRDLAPASDQMLMKAVDDAGPNTSKALVFSADAVAFQLRSIRTTLWELAQPLVFLIVVAVISWITADVVASIAESVPEMDWTGFNGFVQWLAVAISAYGLFIAAGLGVISAVFLWALPRWIGMQRLKVRRLARFRALSRLQRRSGPKFARDAAEFGALGSRRHGSIAKQRPPMAAMALLARFSLA